MNDEAIRLNKFIAEAGICSRREADRLIEAGKVTIDGHRAEQGTKVEPGQTVMIDGKPIRKQEEKVYLAFNKPRGIVCTSEKREKNNIIEYIHYPIRITYCGRLDKESEGLVIMTNDGELLNQMMRSANDHEKEYIVSLDKVINEEFLLGMQNGVYLEELEVTTKKCKVEKLSDTSCRIILTQGLNRQIRRMCENFGYRVMKLTRVRIVNVELGNLKVGTYRDLTTKELELLKQKVYQ
ncbi:MAG TPA: pseudouridine synthase [Lachnospiraceae bacterium]|nr:pseudouridine synthase [Lachnospiraceae bacterium]